MKQIKRIPLILIFLMAVLVLSGCSGVSLADEGLVIGDSYRLESGQTLNTDLTVIGGNAFLAEDSTVNGSLSVLGGNVTANGRVNGDISILGGNVQLGDTARVVGDLTTLGGVVNRAAGAVVEGSSSGARPFRVPMMRTVPVQVHFDPIAGPLMAFFRALALAALAILVHLFAAPQMERTGRAAIAQPIVTGGVGLLTLVVAPALLLLMAITIILLPLSLLGIIILGIAGLFGWLSLGLIVGRQLAVWLKQPWSDPINAGVGTLVLSLLSSMLGLIVCLGWLANFLVSMIALGAVFLTRFGTQEYPPYYSGGLAPRPAAPVVPTDDLYPTPGARVYGADEPRGPAVDNRIDGENI
jgi:hypothetical protein